MNVGTQNKVRLFLYTTCSIALLAAPFLVSAAIVRTGEEVSVHESETILSNLYIFGGNVTVSGEVVGDVIGAGGNVLVNNLVRRDILLGGGTVNIVSPVGDDVRVLGGQVVVGEDVKGDVVVLGGSVQIPSNVEVGGDLIILGGKVIQNGQVGGNVLLYAGDAVFNGKASGNVTIFASESFSFGEGAYVEGNLTYTAPHEATFNQGQIGGRIEFDETRITKDVRSFVGALFGLLFITKVFILLTAALLGVLVFQKFAHMFVARAVTNVWGDLLRGFIILIAVPVMLIFLFFTTIGIMVGTFGLAVFIGLLLLAKIFAGVVFGAFLSKFIQKEITASWQWTIVGVTLLQVLSLIPILGIIVSLFSFLVALGTLSYFIYDYIWLRRT